MKKVILALIVCISLIFIFTGCSKDIPVNIENDNSTSDNSSNDSLTNEDSTDDNSNNDDSTSDRVFGKSALTKIGNGLWYDKTTRIVYWWNGYMNGHIQADRSTTPTPYYAPNGLPYRYNPETKEFEEIIWRE